MFNEVWEDLKFFLSIFKNLKVSEIFSLGNGEGFCVSTGTDEENWVCFPAHVTSKKIVEDAKNFFASREITFTWPLYHEDDKKFFDDLIYAGDLTAMSFEPQKKDFAEKNPDVEFENVEPEIWAEISWRGFGGRAGEMPKNYLDFVKALYENGEKLFFRAAKYKGEYAGTFLLTNRNKNFSGVYYFDTVPELRRRGIAREMMKEICRISYGKKILLQATPMGEKFYKNFGFETLGKIPVYSNESDIL